MSGHHKQSSQVTLQPQTDEQRHSLNMKKTYEASHSRTQGNCTIDRDQEALRVLNSTKASGSAKRDLSQMRGSDDMAKWLEIIGCTVLCQRLQIVVVV